MNRKLLRPLALLCCLALLLPLSGCGGRELYERLLIHGIGVDLSEDGEEYAVSVRTASVGGGELLYRCRGATVLDALGALGLTTGEKPFYAHNYLVVFGRACAERGLEDCLDFFVRYRNARPSVQCCMAAGRAEDILSLRRGEDYLPMAELQQLWDGGRDGGRSLSVDLLEFFNACKRPGSAALLPVLRAGEEQAEICASACFSEFALRGLLNPEETRGLLTARGMLKSGELVLKDPRFRLVTMSVSGCRGRIQTETADDGSRPVFLLKTEVWADLSALDDQAAQPDPEDYLRLEETMAQTLLREAEAAMEKTLWEYGCDVCGLGALLARKDPALWRRVEESWPAALRDGGLRLEVTAAISRLAD